MPITGLTHININCSDYDRSLEFYRMLGFEETWRVPETNAPEIAAAVGMPPYRVKGALLHLQTPGSAPLTIDLLEWVEPHCDEPPYEHLHHYGIARIALATDDLDGDVERLRSAGVEFLSDPVELQATTDSIVRFVCFKDPDGTVLELVETPNRGGS